MFFQSFVFCFDRLDRVTRTSVILFIYGRSCIGCLFSSCVTLYIVLFIMGDHVQESSNISLGQKFIHASWSLSPFSVGQDSMVGGFLFLMKQMDLFFPFDSLRLDVSYAFFMAFLSFFRRTFLTWDNVLIMKIITLLFM